MLMWYASSIVSIISQDTPSVSIILFKNALTWYSFHSLISTNGSALDFSRKDLASSTAGADNVAAADKFGAAGGMPGTFSHVSKLTPSVVAIPRAARFGKYCKKNSMTSSAEMHLYAKCSM